MRSLILLLPLLFSISACREMAGEPVIRVACSESIPERQFFSFHFVSGQNPYTYPLHELATPGPSLRSALNWQRDRNCRERFVEERIVEAGFPAWNFALYRDSGDQSLVLPYFQANSRQVIAFECLRSDAFGWEASLLVRRDLEHLLADESGSREDQQYYRRALDIFTELDRHVFDEDEGMSPTGYGIHAGPPPHPCDP